MTAALTIALFLLLSANLAYASQDTSMSVITKSQEMINDEKAIRERIDKDEKMLLKKAVIKGITLVGKEKITEILQPFKNHWISKDDIQAIIGSIADIYREEGRFERIEGISYKVNKNTLDIKVKEKDD